MHLSSSPTSELAYNRGNCLACTTKVFDRSGPVAAGHEWLVWNISNSSKRDAGYPTTMGTRLVPIAVSRESQDRPFAAMVRGVKAVLQIAGSLSLAWQSTTQRYRPFAASEDFLSSSREPVIPIAGPIPSSDNPEISEAVIHQRLRIFRSGGDGFLVSSRWWTYVGWPDPVFRGWFYIDIARPFDNRGSH